MEREVRELGADGEGDDLGPVHEEEHAVGDDQRDERTGEQRPDAPATGRVRSTARHIHAGVPVRSSGAATNVNSMCWTMCML